MEIKICARGELSKEEIQRVDYWMWQTFHEQTSDCEWSTPDWYVFVWVGEELVSHVDIVERTGMVGGCRVRLGGIGGVTTRPEWRGCGFASAAMREAARFMCDDLGLDFGLLICGKKMIPFYRKLGWGVVEGPLVFDQPKGKMVSTDVAMVLPCARREWPGGEVDLCGPPW